MIWRQGEATAVNFEGARLSGSSLSRTVFSAVRFSGASLDHYELDRIQLKDTDLDRVSLTASDLSYAVIKQSSFHEAKFWRANLTGARFVESTAKAPMFGESNLTGAGLKMIFIPPGRFQMGAPSSDQDAADDERPQHTVIFSKGFWVMPAEVTQALWLTVMENNFSVHQDDDQLPIEMVSWCDAVVFANRLSESHKLQSVYTFPSLLTPGRPTIDSCKEMHNKVQWDRTANGFR